MRSLKIYALHNLNFSNNIYYMFKLKCLFKGHNYFADNKQFPKYLKCANCGHRRLYKGKTLEEK